MVMTRWRWIVSLGLVLVLIGGATGFLLFPGPRRYASEVENFKYGSVGVQAASGVPYEIWRVLPKLCPKLAPAGGYRDFGLIYEPGRDTPIGMPVETVIVPRVGVNCALCHVGQVDLGGGRASRLLIGAPNTRFDLQRYLRFMFACARSDAFTNDNILALIQKQKPLNAFDRFLYGRMVIPQTRDAILKQAEALSFMNRSPDWGPGRTDGFNPAKVQVVGQPYDGSFGATDTPPLWNLRARAGMGLHWDAINTSEREIFLNSGIGNGATPATIDVENLDRMRRWLLDVQPPAYPYPINPTLATRGRALYQIYCGDCHTIGGARTGAAIDNAEVGTDPHRLGVWTAKANEGFSVYRPDGVLAWRRWLGPAMQASPVRFANPYPWRYTHFRTTKGYAAVPLDGIWARAPYLHNGSVPTLWALLSPPDERPTSFYRGDVAYDDRDVGFESQGERARAAGWLYDTRLPGNSAKGHAYGTTLSAEDRRAIVEYLKAL